MECMETINLRGDIDLRVYDADDNLIQREQKKNLIVTVGKTCLAKRLAGDVPYALDYVDKIAFGTDGTAAAIGNTSIATMYTALSTDFSVSYPSANSVRFSGVMAIEDGNGSTYREMGLMTAHGTPKLFSRVVIGDIVKTSSYRVEVDWDISF